MKAKDAVRIAVDAVPTSWADPMLTGPHAVIGQPPYNCADVEHLLIALRARMAIRFDQHSEKQQLGKSGDAK